MNKSREVQEEYLNLRHKVEGRIKELQGKLAPKLQISSSRALSPSHSNSCSHLHSYCHHNCHRGHSSYHQTAHFLNGNSLEVGSNECINVGNRQTTNKTGSVNELISEALVESLKNQRQINDHIKAINDKIETLSAQHNRSNLSDAFSESISKNNIRVLKAKRHQNKEQEQKQRCHSEIKSESRPSRRKKPNPADLNIKKIRNKIKGSENILSINTEKKNKIRSSRNNQSNEKSAGKIKSQYFLSFGCPIHTSNTIMAKSPPAKQIYKDSQYRNRKHQKNHLIQSFKQQQKSRKRVVSKVAHNAFQQYGRN